MLYDGPSREAQRVLIVSPGSPVEVLADIEGRTKVREFGGRLAWAEASALRPKRTLAVVAPSAVGRESPADTAPPVFEAKSGVILEFVELSGAWVKVRHRSGPVGYVRAADVWGL